MNENRILNSEKNETAKRDFPEMSMDMILEAIESFPGRSKKCFEKTKNNRLECAIDLVTVIQANLQIINGLRKKSNVDSFHGQAEFERYEKEVCEMGQEMRGILDTDYFVHIEKSSQENAASKKKEDTEFILTKFDEKIAEIKNFLVNIRGLKVIR